MTNANQKVGMRIRSLREGSGLSQRKLALMIGMDRTYLCGIESGKRNVTLSAIDRVADGLGVTLEELFKGVH